MESEIHKIPSTLQTCSFFSNPFLKFCFLSVLDPAFSAIFFVMPFSHESEHAKLITSLIINLLLAVFYRKSPSYEVIDKSQGDLDSSNSNFFPLCPPRSIPTNQGGHRGNKLPYSCPVIKFPTCQKKKWSCWQALPNSFIDILQDCSSSLCCTKQLCFIHYSVLCYHFNTWQCIFSHLSATDN